MRALLAGEVEQAVFSRGFSAAPDEIESREWGRDRLVAVVPVNHPLAGARSMSLETLLGEDFIGVGTGSDLMATVRESARQIGRELHVKYSVSTMEAARSMVGAGLGLTLQPDCMAFRDADDGVARVAMEGEWAARSYRIGWSRQKPLSAAAAALVEQLTGAAAHEHHAA